MKGGTLVFLDLDDTLFQTGPGPIAAARSRHGHVHSTMQPHQQELLKGLRAMGRVVAVTGRSPEAWERLMVDLDGPAVLSHGAVMLHEDGQIDPDWQALMTRELAGHDVEAVAQAVEALGGLSVRVRRTQGQAHGVHLRHPGRDADATRQRMPELEALVPSGWTVARALHRVDLLPPPVSKERGAAALIARYAPTLVLGIGDAGSDLGFLSLCHVVATPRDSELHRRMARAMP